MSDGLAPIRPDEVAPSNSPLWIGRYELLYEIASGGMAAVFLARAHGGAGFERLVAIKRPHPHLRQDEDFASMFLDEARLASRIHHPNVVSVLDFGEASVPFLVMEYIEGAHLLALNKAALKHGGRLPMGVSVRIIMETLAGLHAAHELRDPDGHLINLVHRDVSPQNVIVGVDGTSRITDFGVAKAEARATVTRDGTVKGKLAYIAPEQLTGKDVTRRADIFAAGVLLWESLCGRRLFRADSEAQTVNMLLNWIVPKPSSVISEIPAELDAIVLKALARDPDKRFATAAEFAEALESGPIKPSATRVVASTLQDLMGPHLAENRELLRKVQARPASQRPDGSQNNAPVGVHVRVPGPQSPIAVPESSERTTLEPDEAKDARVRRRRTAIAVLLIMLTIGGLAFGLRAASQDGPGVMTAGSGDGVEGGTAGRQGSGAVTRDAGEPNALEPPSAVLLPAGLANAQGPRDSGASPMSDRPGVRAVQPPRNRRPRREFSPQAI